MKPMVVCKYRKDIDEFKVFCERNKRNVQSWYCSKERCKYCEFPTVAEIKVSVGRCDQCPMSESDRTPNAGYALDYFCKAQNNRCIARYIEYDAEMPPVPEWCPFRKEKENVKMD